jgi:hypothetical protein
VGVIREKILHKDIRYKILYNWRDLQFHGINYFASQWLTGINELYLDSPVHYYVVICNSRSLITPWDKIEDNKYQYYIYSFSSEMENFNYSLLYI